MTNTSLLAVGALLWALPLQCLAASDQCSDASKVQKEYEKSWDDVVADKKAAIEDGMRTLEGLRADLKKDKEDTVGKTGGLKEGGIAVAMVAKATSDLTRNMIAIFEPSPSEVEKMAMTILDKTRKGIEHSKGIDDADQAVDSKMAFVKDKLKGIVPGLQMAQEMDDWTNANREVSRQIDAIDRSLKEARAKLAALGGPERHYSVDELLKRSEPRVYQCVDPTPKKVSKPKTPKPSVDKPSIRLTQKPQKTTRQLAEPTEACSLFDSC